MPNKTLLLSAIALAITTASATLYWRLQADTEAVAHVAAAPAASAPASARSEQPGEQPPKAETETKPAVDPTLVDAYSKRLAFDSEYRGFFDKASQLPEAEREAEAERLRKGLEEREARGELAASESLMLQIALIQATESDPEEQKSRANALLRRYQEASEAREKALAQQPSPQFQRYKQDEKRIVEEVMALEAIPDGLSRNEYLRQRLQEAREQAYR
ncbi:hypothetical protein NRL37_10945 [Metapseudomonas otitidis]|uniref:hypothetical protein n=1 Tax=Metapseudomonas otitidis TaxID=319939 RepID=UPI00227A4408|nr:hypothetical protein [Pseudomonas otitidis]WAF87935.1 hypothetical protein NRL37_10945 [Pseudomonas otitidis]